MRAQVMAEKYRSQMDWYARAVEATTGRKVRARYLYFFDREGCVERLRSNP